MAPTPPLSNLLNVPRAAAPPPPFPTPSAGDKLGLCGLTGDQWHVVMILAIFCEFCASDRGFPADPVSYLLCVPVPSLRSFDHLCCRDRRIVAHFEGYRFSMAPSAAAR